MTDSASSLGAVLLAAGGSTRLGVAKQLLQLPQWNGQTLVARQAKLLLELGIKSVVVVTGAERQRVESALEGLPVQLGYNENWRDGMGSSLACGIRSMPERVRGALLLLCDQWRVEGTDLARLCGEWAQHPTSAVVSEWAENSGPPAIFPRALFDRLGRLKGDKGAKKALSRYTGGVRYVRNDNAAFDIDAPEDLPG